MPKHEGSKEGTAGLGPETLTATAGTHSQALAKDNYLVLSTSNCKAGVTIVTKALSEVLEDSERRGDMCDAQKKKNPSKAQKFCKDNFPLDIRSTNPPSELITLGSPHRPVHRWLHAIHPQLPVYIAGDGSDKWHAASQEHPQSLGVEIPALRPSCCMLALQKYGERKPDVYLVLVALMLWEGKK